MAKPSFKSQLKDVRDTETSSPIRVAVPQIDPGEPGKVQVSGAPIGRAAVAASPALTTPPAETSPTGTPTQQTDIREQFNTKLPPELIGRIKIYSATKRIEMQYVSQAAYEELLEREGF